MKDHVKDMGAKILIAFPTFLTVPAAANVITKEKENILSWNKEQKNQSGSQLFYIPASTNLRR